jgi:hypothetical protein
MTNSEIFEKELSYIQDIELLAAQQRIQELEKVFADCRNELCLKCGLYRDRYLGKEG